MVDPRIIELEGDSEITIENPEAPVNEDLSIAPPPKTETIYPPITPTEENEK